MIQIEKGEINIRFSKADLGDCKANRILIYDGKCWKEGNPISSGDKAIHTNVDIHHDV